MIFRGLAIVKIGMISCVFKFCFSPLFEGDVFLPFLYKNKRTSGLEGRLFVSASLSCGKKRVGMLESRSVFNCIQDNAPVGGDN